VPNDENTSPTAASRAARLTRPLSLLGWSFACVLLVVLGGAAFAGIRVGLNVRENNARATQAVELKQQYDLGVTDLAAGRYALAAERFQYILTLDPKEKAVGVGDSFTVDVILDTDGKQVDGVDLYSLHYDPTILNVVDGVSAKPGIQVIPGTIMDFNAVNSVDQATGTIKFSQAATGGTSFSGKGVLASIHFKAVGKGSTYLKFDFSFGSTKDTNVAHAGKDQLARVVDALYTVK